MINRPEKSPVSPATDTSSHHEKSCSTLPTSVGTKGGTLALLTRLLGKNLIPHPDAKDISYHIISEQNPKDPRNHVFNVKVEERYSTKGVPHRQVVSAQSSDRFAQSSNLSAQAGDPPKPRITFISVRTGEEVPPEHFDSPTPAPAGKPKISSVPVGKSKITPAPTPVGKAKIATAPVDKPKIFRATLAEVIKKAKANNNTLTGPVAPAPPMASNVDDSLRVQTLRVWPVEQVDAMSDLGRSKNAYRGQLDRPASQAMKSTNGPSRQVSEFSLPESYGEAGKSGKNRNLCGQSNLVPSSERKHFRGPSDLSFGAPASPQFKLLVSQPEDRPAVRDLKWDRNYFHGDDGDSKNTSDFFSEKNRSDKEVYLKLPKRSN